MPQPSEHSTPGTQLKVNADIKKDMAAEISAVIDENKNDTMDFISSWDLQERFSHILEAGRANLLDGFAISRRFSTEYINGSLRLFPMHWNMDIGLERYRATVSDHLPFVANFRLDDLD